MTTAPGWIVATVPAEGRDAPSTCDRCGGPGGVRYTCSCCKALGCDLCIPAGVGGLCIPCSEAGETVVAPAPLKVDPRQMELPL